jgi:DNA mismatch endonuclease, patch repair protein
MRSTRREGTRAELELRGRLWSQGLRFRVQYSVAGLPRRRIDIAFPRARLAIFVDGCFWHRCPEHYSLPHANGTWWREKLERNVQRDIETRERLTVLGWSVMRVWEHEDPEVAAGRIAAALRTLD